MLTSQSSQTTTDLETADEAWVRSTCIICLNRCGIRVHRNTGGNVDKIVGDSELIVFD